MIEVPTVVPKARPVEEPIVTFVLLLLHAPPVVASVNVTDEPTQIDVGPLMLAGNGNTVKEAVLLQLPPME